MHEKRKPIVKQQSVSFMLFYDEFLLVLNVDAFGQSFFIPTSISAIDCVDSIVIMDFQKKM
jgi:hypothetical protein